MRKCLLYIFILVLIDTEPRFRKLSVEVNAIFFLYHYSIETDEITVSHSKLSGALMVFQSLSWNSYHVLVVNSGCN